jgi:VIT1/CCC1 family predicted Fe2+/Mn2+ transporter
VSVPTGDELILDELLDLTLYQELTHHAEGPTAKMLKELVVVETRHLQFWKEFFKQPKAELDWGRRLKLRVLSGLCWIFGEPAIHLVLEAIEIYGIRKYLLLWRESKGQPIEKALEGILRDEFEHEDAIVAQVANRRIDPDAIRNIFLGLNDGLVEILGAVSGFFASLQEPRLVLMASTSVAVAGALSMAAGAFVAASSAFEVQAIEDGKAAFLGQEPRRGAPVRPWRSALLVGGSYFAGAVIPVLPVFFGATTLAASAVAAALMISAVSLLLAFLSGMAVRKRIVLNVVIMAAAVAVTYAIGSATKRFWGVSV